DGQAVDERERLDPTLVRLDHQPMVDEVEGDLERAPVLRVQTARRQTAHTDVEGNVPPVVARWARGHADLADDLHPEMQRLLRRLPRGERELGERRRARHRSARSARS